MSVPLGSVSVPGGISLADWVNQFNRAGGMGYGPGTPTPAFQAGFRAPGPAFTGSPGPAPKQGSSASQGGPPTAPGQSQPVPGQPPQGRGSFGYPPPTLGAAPVAPVAGAAPAAVAQAPAPTLPFAMQQTALPQGVALPAAAMAPVLPPPLVPGPVAANPIRAAIMNAAGGWSPGLTPYRRPMGVPLFR
jgi:hypothetical protein